MQIILDAEEAWSLMTIMVSQMIDAYRSRLSLTISVEGDDCDAGDRALWLQYWTSIAKALEDYPPKASKVSIVLEVTPNVKAMSGSIAKDGTLVIPSEYLEAVITKL